jgi:hypothetical protein
MINECWISKNFEASGGGLIKILSMNLRVWTEDNHE